MSDKPPLTRVTVSRFLERAAGRLSLELVAGQRGLNRIIAEPAINRPGLALAGFYNYFPNKRIQLIGFAEFSFLMSLAPDVRARRLADFFGAHVPCVVFARNKRPFPDVADLAEQFSIPVMRTQMVTGLFMNAATIIMEDLCAPRVKVHGTMMEVAGIGVLIEGQPGIGKSETALELVKRGHRLVADDVVQIRMVEEGKLVGSSPEVLRYLLEIRGLGIIDVRNMYGIGAVIHDKSIDIVMQFEPWQPDRQYERLGLREETISILDVKVPYIVTPVMPGRNLAIIAEVAAMNFRLKKIGYSTAAELDRRMMGELHLLQPPDKREP